MNRRWFGAVLVALGAFLVVAAVVAQVWAPDVVKRTPIDVNQTTYLEGNADKLDPTTGKLVSNPIYALDVTRSDSDASTGSVAVFVETTCVVVDEGQPRECVSAKDPRLVTAVIDTFATDRHTAIAVNGDQYLPADAVPHEGLVNKWPFDAQKKTYPYWEGTLGKAVPAEYVRTADVKGMQTYVYRVTTKGAKIDVVSDIPGTYDDVKEIYVEPRTGGIVQQTENQQRYLEDGQKILDLQLGFTDQQQQDMVNEVNDKYKLVDLALNKVPVIGYAVGIPVFLIGLALLFVRRRDRGRGGPALEAEQPEAPRPAQPVG